MMSFDRRKAAIAAVLVLVGATAFWIRQRHGGRLAPQAELAALYQCPMHPHIVQKGPGSCPICHMPLVPVETSPQEAQKGGDRAVVSITKERQQLIGVRTAAAEFRDLKHVIRASGRVAHDPELYSAMAEYIQAVRSLEGMNEGISGESKGMAQSLVRSSKTRLRMMGLGDGQIRKLSREGAEPPEHLLLAQHGGKVWVYADVYQQEMGLIKPGMPLKVRLRTAASKPDLPGTVLSVDPMVDSMTRTARVRVEVDNHEGLLTPDMYLEVSIEVPLGRRLSVPREAVLDTGEKQLVFVVGREGESFEPREVRTGPAGDDHAEVFSGLLEGETVVASANFLIDSESRLKAAVEAFQAR